MKINKCRSLSISSNDFEALKLKMIGEGKDAIVYDAGKGLLYKIYKKNENRIIYLPEDDIIDEEGVRIAKTRGNRKSLPSISVTKSLDYVDRDGVKLHSADAIKKAIKRQENVENTILPLAPIYINGRFGGCILQKHKAALELHKIWAFLPKSEKIKLLKKIKSNTDELCRNYIYHTDLANKGIGEFATDVSHSNILVTPNLNPQIIDIDGQSAVYREEKNDYYENVCYSTFDTLLLELLFDLDLGDNMSRIDIEHYIYLLKRRNLPQDIAQSLLEREAGSDIIDEVIDMAQCKKLKI